MTHYDFLIGLLPTHDVKNQMYTAFPICLPSNHILLVRAYLQDLRLHDKNDMLALKTKGTHTTYLWVSNIL